MRCAITTQIAKTCGALTFLFFRDRCAGTLLERQEAKWAGKFCLHDEDGNSSHDMYNNARFLCSHPFCLHRACTAVQLVFH